MFPAMISKLKNFALLLIAVSFFAVAGSGCNTTKGLGKDVEKLGDKIQEKSSR